MSFVHRTNPTRRTILTVIAIALFATAMCGQGGAQPLPCRYQVSAVIQAPNCGLGEVITVGTAINPSGTTVVGYRLCLGVPRPWKWTKDGGLVMLTLPSWLVEAMPSDVNDSNFMVGNGVGPAAGQRGWMCDLNTMTWTELLPQNPPTGWSGASAINNSNVVVGFRSIGSKGDPVNPRTAYRWSGGSFIDLGVVDGNATSALDIAHDGIAAVSIGFGLRADWWDGASSMNLGTVAGADGLTPNAIANETRIVGAASFIQAPTVWSKAFEYRGGTIRTLPDLNAANGSCTALAVNGGGLIVGGCTPIGIQAWKPCAWIDGEVVDLRQIVDGAGGLSLSYAVDISETGVILCRASAAQVVSVLLAPLPRLLGDTNCDQHVDVDDLVTVILAWGTASVSADVTDDGIVDVNDLILVINSWTI